MALNGNLKDFPLPEILQLIASLEKTGILSLNRGHQCVTVGFHAGAVVHAESRARSLAEQVAATLIRCKALSPVELSRAEAQLVEGEQLTQALVREGLVEADVVSDVLQICVGDQVYDLLAWNDAQYAFDQDTEPLYDAEHFEPLRVQHILMEGMRILDEWTVIRKKLRTFDLVLQHVDEYDATEDNLPAAPPAEVRFPVDLENPLDAAPDDPPSAGENVVSRSAEKKEIAVDMTTSECIVYEEIDGTSTVQAIIDRTLLPRHEIVRAFYDLWDRNIIRPAFQGSLSETTFPDLFSAVRSSQGTGRLTFKKDDETLTLSFFEGAFMLASTSDAEDALGPYLLNEGVLNRAALEGAPAGADWKAVGDYLIESGALRRPQFEQHAVQYMCSLTSPLFSWTEGTYQFQGVAIRREDGLDLDPWVVDLMVQGIEGIKRWSRIESEAGALDTEYTGNPNADELRRDIPTEARTVLDAFSTAMSLESAIEKTGLPEAKVLRWAWALRALGGLHRRTGEHENLRFFRRALAAGSSGPLPEPEVIEPQAAFSSASSRAPLPESADTVKRPKGATKSRSGSSTKLQFPALFREFYRERTIGVLMATSETRSTHITFMHGSVVAASGNATGNRLGEVMVRLGLVDDATVDAVLADAPTRRLGRAFVDRGLITEDQLERAVEQQVRDVILPMFAWESVEYDLEEGELSTEDYSTCQLSTAELIIEGCQRSETIETARQLLSDELSLAPHCDQHFRFQKARLRPEEGFLLSQMNGATTIREILQLSPVDEETTYRTMYAILQSGLVEFAEKDRIHTTASFVSPHTTHTERPVAGPEEEEVAAELKRSQGLDAFGILGLERTASLRSIDIAYRELAKKFHPDTGRTARQKEMMERVFSRIVWAGQSARATLLKA